MRFLPQIEHDSGLVRMRSYTDGAEKRMGKRDLRLSISNDFGNINHQPGRSLHHKNVGRNLRGIEIQAGLWRNGDGVVLLSAEETDGKSGSF